MPVDIDAVVLSNDRLSPDSNVLRLAAPEVATLSRPGQFVMVKQSLSAEPFLRRPFSIFEILRGPRGTIEGLSLLNKIVGVVTQALHGLEPGQRLYCLGPLGQPFTPCGTTREAWFVAGGVGLAPFLSFAEDLTAQGTPTTLFYGGHTARDLHCIEQFERLGVRVVTTTEDGSHGERGLVTGPLGRALASMPDGADVMVYTCGPTPMMRAVVQLASQHGRPVEVSLEPVMGCGLGGCYGCVVPIRADAGRSRYVRACLDGPVFRGDDVDWSDLVERH